MTTPEQRDTVERRERKVLGWRPYFAATLIVAAFVFVGVELLRYWLRGIPISGVVIALGGTIGFLGAYMFDHADTKDAAAFIITNGISIVNAIPNAIRGGRRSTDPPVVVPPPIDQTLPRGTQTPPDTNNEGG